MDMRIFNVRKMLTATMASLSVSLLLFIALPLQSYLQNASQFGFGISELLCECLLWCGAATVGIAFLLLILEPIFGKFFHVVTIAIGVCMYLESGILAYGLGELDGNIWLYTDVTRKIVDSSILLVIFICLVCSYKWVKNYIAYISIGLIVMSAASVFDVKKIEKDDFDKDVEKGFCTKFDVVKSLSFSDSRNIMVLVLDSFPASVVKELMDENESLRNQFPGFVAYDNNIAMHDVTRRGMPGLLTGEYYGDNGMTLVDYSRSLYGTNSFFYPYYAANDVVHMLGGVYECGYTNRRKSFSDAERIGERKGSVLFRRSNTIPYLNLAETIRFRCTPYKMKSIVLYSIVSGINMGPQADADPFMVPILAEAPVEHDSKQALLMLHTRGIHLPIVIDKDGNRMMSSKDDRDGLKGFAHYLLKLYGGLFDRLRERGLYDKCMIVITTDHGSPLLSHDGIMGQPDAMLWVKPIGSVQHCFQNSRVPTSHCRIAELIKRAHNEDLSEEEIMGILRQEKRFYRGKPSRMSPFVEYWYDDAGNIIDKKENANVSDT